jgi:hypothetical protein
MLGIDARQAETPLPGGAPLLGPVECQANARHSHAATWHHRGQQREYRSAPWPRPPNTPAPATSDSESESSSIDLQSSQMRPLHRNVSAPSALSSIKCGKRTYSEASESSDAELDSLDKATAVSSGGTVGKTSSGTWPRLTKRSGRASLRDVDIWQLTQSLARERSDLAGQLARMTARARSLARERSDLAGELARMTARAERDTRPRDRDDDHGLYHQYRSTALSEWEGDDSVEKQMRELDELVAKEHQQQTTGVDDGTGMRS